MSLKQPKLIHKAFAENGNKYEIQTDSQIGIKDGKASYETGFPPLTMTPIQAGGVAPFGQDVNGILFELSNAVRYLQAGMFYPFDADFAKAIGGYNAGAIVLGKDNKLYRSKINNNTQNATKDDNWEMFADVNYLPLTGGKITGDLAIDKKNAGIKLSTNDTNYTLSTSASGDAFSFYFPDAVNDYTQRLTYTKQDKTFNFKNCDVKINDSDVITSKNIKSHVGSGKIIAWGRFDYFTNSSIKIIASQGVSAITRNAVGRYTITLSESIDDMKYVVTCNSQQNKREDECFANTCVPMRLKENQFEIWCTDNQQDKFFDTSNCYFIVVVNNN